MEYVYSLSLDFPHFVWVQLLLNHIRFHDPGTSFNIGIHFAYTALKNFNPSTTTGTPGQMCPSSEY